LFSAFKKEKERKNRVVMTEMPTLGVFGMVMGMKILIFGLERIKLLRCCCRASMKFATANTYTKHCC